MHIIVINKAPGRPSFASGIRRLIKSQFIAKGICNGHFDSVPLGHLMARIGMFILFIPQMLAVGGDI